MSLSVLKWKYVCIMRVFFIQREINFDCSVICEGVSEDCHYLSSNNNKINNNINNNNNRTTRRRPSPIRQKFEIVNRSSASPTYSSKVLADSDRFPVSVNRYPVNANNNRFLLNANRHPLNTDRYSSRAISRCGKPVFAREVIVRRDSGTKSPLFNCSATATIVADNSCRPRRQQQQQQHPINHNFVVKNNSFELSSDNSDDLSSLGIHTYHTYIHKHSGNKIF